MNYGIYVEGQSEMIFVADVLSKYSLYDPALCGYKCINLRANQFEYKPNPIQGSKDSANYYQIVNVNNDDLVISKIRDSLNDLIRKNYDIIIGLRDVFGNNYKNITKNRPVVDHDVISKFWSRSHAEISSSNIEVRLHFAVMEFEAWLLALLKLYVQKNGSDGLLPFDKNDLNDICNVENIYHPTPLLIKLLEKTGKSYDKSEQDTIALLSFFTKDDYEDLRKSGASPSFSHFIDSLIGNWGYY